MHLFNRNKFVISLLTLTAEHLAPDTCATTSSFFSTNWQPAWDFLGQF